MNSTAAPRVGRYRWVICALLFFATTINYMDRQILGILAPVLQKEIGWNETQYGYIVSAFQAAYAIGLLLVGRAIDLSGTRLGYSVSVVFWSIAAMAHAAVHTVFGFGCVRFALGLGEAGNFPAAIKAVAEWFPKRERALATGIFNSGSNIGAIVTPLLVPWITLNFGWRWAYLATGVVGFVWVVAWHAMYRVPQEHPRVSKAELDHILSDPVEPVTPIPWVRLLTNREALGFTAARFFSDGIWWFYLFWAPKFLDARFGIGLAKIGVPLVAMYLIANLGSILGGWLSGVLLARGFTVNASRKLSVLASILLIAPIASVTFVSKPWMAVALLGMAMAGHAGYAANIFTMISDVFPRRAVSSVIGISGFGAAIGGMLLAAVVGRVLDQTHSYTPIFIWSGMVYFLVLGLLHLGSPRLAPAKVE
jgi:ACS family hexuronate transporter-like MFS transporter